MRILQVTADGSPAGGATHVLQVLRRLSVGGGGAHEMGVASQARSYLLREAQAFGIATFPLEFFRSRLDVATALRLRLAVRRFAPDVVHVHGARAAFLHTLMTPPRPTVNTVHGLRFHHAESWRRALGRMAERRIARHVDHVIFVSDYDAAVAATRRLLPKGLRFSVIPNGVATGEIPRASDRTAPHVGFIGRLESQKDPLLFVEVARRLPDAAITIVGAGSLEADVHDALQGAALRHVRRLGRLDRPDALAVLATLTCLVMTSRWEGLPFVALEAMCAGVPVVATRVGGLPELIENGASGILVDGRSPDDIAHAVTVLHTNRELRARIVEGARRRVETAFSEARMLRGIERVYEEVVVPPCHTP